MVTSKQKGLRRYFKSNEVQCSSFILSVHPLWLEGNSNLGLRDCLHGERKILALGRS